MARKIKCIYENPSSNPALRLNGLPVFSESESEGPKFTELIPPTALALSRVSSSSPSHDILSLSPFNIPSPKLVEVDDDGQPLDDDSGRTLNNEQTSLHMIDVNRYLQPEILFQPRSPFQLMLDDKGLQLVEYFLTEVVKTICIVPQGHKNHLSLTLLSVAHGDESVMNLLAGWGALFRDGPDSNSFKYRILRADKVARRLYEGKQLDDRGNFNMLCYHLNLAGIGVCSGDTSEWYELLHKCMTKIKEFGSIDGILKRFGYLDEVRWVVSNFQYHDVMSLVSLKYGTMFGMEEYALLFEDENDFSYGMDPLQGCIHPVFLLLGEIMNVNATLRRSRQLIEKLLDALQHDPLAGDELSTLQHRRMQHYINASKEAARLMAKINECEPQSNQQCFLEEADLEDHLTLFEAFRNTCKLYVLLYIQETQPRAPEVQLILLDTFKLVDLLINCNLRPAIGMIMLICGLCCCYPADRMEMQRKFTRLFTHYKVFNLNKVRHIVEQSWVANPDGNINIDWPDLCEMIGWKLSAS